MGPSARHCPETLSLFQGRLGIEYEHIKNLGIGFAYRRVIMILIFGNSQKCSDYAHIWCEQFFW